FHVTGVQTCALPIYLRPRCRSPVGSAGPAGQRRDPRPKIPAEPEGAGDPRPLRRMPDREMTIAEFPSGPTARRVSVPVMVGNVEIGRASCRGRGKDA